MAMTYKGFYKNESMSSENAPTCNGLSQSPIFEQKQKVYSLKEKTNE